MTQNKVDRQRLRECASRIQENLEAAQRCMSSHTGPLPKALNAFTTSVQEIGRDADALVAACKGPIQRYLLARDHKSKISELLARLIQADRDFCRSLALDTNLRVHESRSLELDTNHRVNDLQSTTSAHLSSVQDELRAVKATIAVFVADTDHRVKDIHLVTSTHHDIVRAELHALKAGVAHLSQVSHFIGLFAVARS
ncbi:hypothetical protein PENSPDRAFT_331744 [Peniophora sp. CONT]|nr:hypothetical protein PENSPDRAFT_331744 [Peniophora sp. CONT]